FKILSALIENKNKIVSREELATILSSRSNARTLDGHIKNIRKKLAQIDKLAKDILTTEYGLGYKLSI
ncbi:MAG: winged helix-turn-helix transcriptional regulator, partial [Epsilonproteobacteria bacterium]|nr:winged helix-turn-helix transcriptional regulator [Campylobacterota bacterium]